MLKGYTNYVVVVQSPRHVQLFATPRTAALQASLSLTISQSLAKFISIASVMPSSHLILCCPLLLLVSSSARIQTWQPHPSSLFLTLIVYCMYISSGQIDGETMETVTDFILGGSKITADGDCNHEIKRRLLLGRKAKTNLDSILKSRDIILLTKVHLIKAMVFPVVMYGCESWTTKKAGR